MVEYKKTQKSRVATIQTWECGRPGCQGPFSPRCCPRTRSTGARRHLAGAPPLKFLARGRPAKLVSRGCCRFDTDASGTIDAGELKQTLNGMLLALCPSVPIRVHRFNSPKHLSKSLQYWFTLQSSGLSGDTRIEDSCGA